MCDRRARRRTKIRRLAYRLGLAENQCTGNLTVASDFLVPIAVKRGSKFVGSCAAGADIRFPEMLAPDQSVALSLIVNKVASISRIAAPAAGQVLPLGISSHKRPFAEPISPKQSSTTKDQKVGTVGSSAAIPVIGFTSTADSRRPNAAGQGGISQFKFAA